ncbi:MAG: Mur ligase domain-containing protein [Phycisphaeraceae bacterium]
MTSSRPQPVISLEPDQPLLLHGARVHFVGIGGCGMSGLARIAQAAGAICSGSDMGESAVTQSLVSHDIPVTFQQTAESVPARCDLVVISAAINAQHPERLEAQRRDIPVMKYAQMLGRLMLGRTGVAVSGTHGKSTTTSMLAHAAIHAGLDPTFIVGATCQQIGGGCRVSSRDLGQKKGSGTKGRRDEGKEAEPIPTSSLRPSVPSSLPKDLLIAEACEYDRSFHNFHPTHSIILNVEEDHLDCYGSLDEVVKSFNHFAKLTGGNIAACQCGAIAPSLLIGHESAHRTAVAAGVSCPVETIGFAPEADYSVEAVTSGGIAGRQHVTVNQHGQPLISFDLQIPGEHMAYNAAVAAVTALRLGASPRLVSEALSDFRGLDRRMQVLGTTDSASGGDVMVIDDYGHHPTEIHTTLRALRRHYQPQRRGGRLICVFQPHQHSRTRFLLEQFATSFGEADVVIVPHIYFVRDSEEDRRAVSAADLVKRLHNRGTEALHIDDFADIVTWLKTNTQPHDLLVVMGAGPVWQVAYDFLGLKH